MPDPTTMRAWLAHALSDWGRGALGGGLGIALTALVSALVLGLAAPGLPLIVAPMGASAVLVFVRPASPFSQPWPLIGGQLLSASAGLMAALLVGPSLLAGGLAVALSIMAMGTARALHPPGGGTALLFAMGAAGAEHWGGAHLLTVALNALLLAGFAWFYNNLTGHEWPHRTVMPPAPVRPIGSGPISLADVEEVVAEWNEPVDIHPDDLLALIQAVERQRDRSGRTGT